MACQSHHPSPVVECVHTNSPLLAVSSQPKLLSLNDHGSTIVSRSALSALTSFSPLNAVLIPVSRHWQLRSLISAEKEYIVYFPGGHGSNHVQRLDTNTHECETIKLLNFAPRCLVAELGWLCCGSETGEFAAIRLDEGSEGSGDSPYLDPDARLSLDVTRDEPLSFLAAEIRRSNKSLIAKSMKLAKDRVNCITLWFPHSRACSVAYSEPVAVLANNDKTVTIVSLNDFNQNEKTEPLAVITYPDFVNRAIISPDGSLLIAILDDPYLYIHRRVGKTDMSASPRSRDRSENQWEEMQRILLKSQRKDDRSDSRGSFAACFSNTGAYLAVGTQHGTISIFDTAFLTDVRADPLITSFDSSRPESGAGAVRDMAFCPGPFDILAWTEDRGHIGIADVRTNFSVRQIVDINAEAEFEHINILDRNTIDPRLLEHRRDRRPRSDRREDGVAGDDGQTGGNRDGEDVDSVNRPFTAYELGIIEAMRNRRRFRDRAGQRESTSRQNAEDVARGMADTSWSNLSNLRPSPNESESPRTRERSSSLNRALGILTTTREQPSLIANRIRSGRGLTRDNSDRQPDSRRSGQRWVGTMGETVAAMRDQRERQDTSYLNVLEILQGRERGDSERDDTSLLAPLANQVVSRWEESAIRGTLAPDTGVFEVPPSPDNTAGLAWSEDGCTL